jgi:signal transduction histidine kinase
VKTLEADMRRAERLASLGALASGIAHEIKNPLVAIRTFAELLPERFSDAEFRDSFARVAREIERIDLLIARLRGLASSHERQIGPVNLMESLDDTLALLRAQLEHKHIVVTRSSTSPTCLLLGDAAQLKQLFLNILLNAIESMHDGGVLTIEVENASANDSTVHTVRVTDTGIGIPATVLSRVFDPFVTTKPDGSGLGLAICRNIADAHHAAIAVTNNSQGSGTTVTLSFPPLRQMAELLPH